MSEPRQHHILPAFYLAGFTDDGTIDGTLHVFDYRRRKRYSARPRRVGRERDFYRVYEPNTDPYITEKDLAVLEGQLASDLSRVLRAGTIRCTQDLASALSLAALNYARAQRARAQLSTALTESIRAKLAAGEVTREQWEALMAAEERAGVAAEMRPTFDEALRLVAQQGWQPKAPEVLKVGLIPDVQRLVCHAIANRTWSLARTDEATGYFICSDTPLTWSDDPNTTARLDDDRNTISVPLSKHLALITRTDGRRGTYTATRELVAAINSRTYFSSLGSLYWDGNDFPLLRNGWVAKGSDYLDFVEDLRRRGVEKP